MEIEASNLLAQQSVIDENDHAIISVDIVDCFPSIHKQPLYDLPVGVASEDYPGTSLHKCYTPPSTPLLLS